MLSSLGDVTRGITGPVPGLSGVGPPDPGICCFQKVPKGLEGLWLQSTDEEDIASKLDQGQHSGSKAG